MIPIKENLTEQDAINYLLQRGVQAFRLQCGYVADKMPVDANEIEPFGEKPLDGMHTYNVNMIVGGTYSMSPKEPKTIWLRKICGVPKSRFLSILDRYIKFVLVK